MTYWESLRAHADHCLSSCQQHRHEVVAGQDLGALVLHGPRHHAYLLRLLPQSSALNQENVKLHTLSMSFVTSLSIGCGVWTCHSIILTFDCIHRRPTHRKPPSTSACCALEDPSASRPRSSRARSLSSGRSRPGSDPLRLPRTAK